MSDKPVTQMVRCPRCRKSLIYDQTSKFRPFCSDLCKNEDIISWAQQDYRIAGAPLKQDDKAEAEDPDEET